MSRGRGRAPRPLRSFWTSVGGVGAVFLGLLAYMAYGPGIQLNDSGGMNPSPTVVSRWAAVPTGWQHWRTTLYEPAAQGRTEALGKWGGDPSDAACLRHEDAVYCAGSSILPVRLDGRSGKTVWRAACAPTDDPGALCVSTILGVRDGTVLARQTIYGDDAVTRVLAVDAESGETRWTRQADYPTLSGDLALTTDASGSKVTARSLRSGAERWTAQIPAGDHCTFTDVGTRLYAHCFPSTEDPRRAQLLELKRADGSVVRRLSTPYKSALLGAVDGRLAVLLASRPGPGAVTKDSDFGSLLLIDPDTEARTTTELADTYEGSVTLAAGTLWISRADGRVAAVSPLTGQQLWESRTNVEYSGGPTYDARPRTLYVVSPSGRIAALDASGGELLWETGPQAKQLLTTSDGVMFKAGVLPYGGALIAFTPDGTVLSLDPAHPEETSSPG